MSTNFSELINGLNIDESSKAIMQKIVAELLCVIAEKDKIIVEQAKQIEEQTLVIKSQGAEILEVQRQLKMDSSNSSLPPSSDLNKKKKKSDDKPGNGEMSNRGGKSGHKGTTLNQVKKPDRIKKMMLEKCSCGSRDLRVTSSYEARQEFDVEIKRVVTEHRLIHCKCGSCGLVSKPASDLPSNAFYSEKVKAYAVYMLDLRT